MIAVAPIVAAVWRRWRWPSSVSGIPAHDFFSMMLMMLMSTLMSMMLPSFSFCCDVVYLADGVDLEFDSQQPVGVYHVRRTVSYSEL